MFRLHCNKCYRNRSLEPALIFHFSRCHHILCASCLDDTSKDQKCPLCSLTLQTIPISGNMPSGMAQYFEDPTKFLQLYRKISKFQSDQRTSDNVGFWRQMQEEQTMKLQLQGYAKMEEQFNKQINIEKMRIAEMRDYISYHEQKQLVRRRSMDDFKTLKSAHKRHRPRTPCFSSTDNTRSEESLGASLDSGTGTQKQNLDENRTMTTSQDSDYTVL